MQQLFYLIATYSHSHIQFTQDAHSLNSNYKQAQLCTVRLQRIPKRSPHIIQSAAIGIVWYARNATKGSHVFKITYSCQSFINSVILSII